LVPGALQNKTTGNLNIAIGTEALQQNDANFNLGKRTSTLLLVCHIR
jgi:hypothetical protein